MKRVKKRVLAPPPRLPDPGEKLEFGKHRLPHTEAETAEAWPPLLSPIDPLTGEDRTYLYAPGKERR